MKFNVIKFLFLSQLAILYFCFVININVSAQPLGSLFDAPSENNSADYAMSLSGHTNYWHREKMPLKVFIHDGTFVSGYKSEFKQYFLDACKSWESASGGKVQFVFVNSNSADIEVAWTNDRSKLMQSQELGETRCHTNPDGLDHVSIKLLTISKDGLSQISDHEAWSMCLHELGHALGLGGHSNSTSDIMCPKVMYSSSLPVSNISLSSRDIATINRLYTEKDSLMEKIVMANGSLHDKSIFYCYLGSRQISQKKFESACNTLEQALTFEPNSLQAQDGLHVACFNLAMEYIQSGDFQRALVRLKQCLPLVEKLQGRNSQQYKETERFIQECKSRITVR